MSAAVAGAGPSRVGRRCALADCSGMQRLATRCSSRGLFLAVAVVTTVALAPRIARAQPMIDPSKMSGVPRPDPQVPPGTITVRVLRGDFEHGMVGQEVVLAGPDGEKRATTDDSTRVAFSGLTAGATYVARATAGGTTLTSQPIELPPAPGVRLMLVFPRDEAALLGEPDGKARPDPALPAGDLLVKLVDAAGKPLAGVPVVLGKAGPGDEHIGEQRAASGTDGRVRFAGLARGEGDTYAVKAKQGDALAASEPFRLDGDHGKQVALRLAPSSHDLGQLTIAQRSHLVIELRDDDVSVVENLVVENLAGVPVDPGPKGLRLPLPAEAQGAQLAEGGLAGVRLEGDAIVIGAPVPTGQSELRFGFTLPLHDGVIALRQPTPLAFVDVLAVVDHIDGLRVGDGYEMQERAMPSGRSVWVVSGPGTRAGGELALRIEGLPQPSTFWRFAATGVALVIVLWGLYAGLARGAAGASGGEVPATRRHALEERREALLDELAKIDGGGGGKRRPPRRREELLGELESVYRQLDEAAG